MSVEKFEDLFLAKPAEIPFLRAQRTALETRLGQLGAKWEDGWLTSMATLELAGTPTDEPEGCVIWDPQSAFVVDPNSIDEEFLADVAKDGFVTVEAARLVWAACIKQIGLRLARRQEVDLVYLKLVPHPLHPHWPLWVVNEFGWGEKVSQEDLMNFMSCTEPSRIAKHPTTKEMQISIAAIPDAKLSHACAEYELRIFRTKVNYHDHLARWIREIGGHIGAMWADYREKSLGKIWDKSACSCESNYKHPIEIRYEFRMATPYGNVTLVEEPLAEEYDIPATLERLDREAQIVQNMYDIQQRIWDLRVPKRTLAESGYTGGSPTRLSLPDATGVRSP